MSKSYWTKSTNKQIVYIMYRRRFSLLTSQSTYTILYSSKQFYTILYSSKIKESFVLLCDVVAFKCTIYPYIDSLIQRFLSRTKSEFILWSSSLGLHLDDVCWRLVWDVGDRFFILQKSSTWFCHQHLKTVTNITVAGRGWYMIFQMSDSLTSGAMKPNALKNPKLTMKIRKISLLLSVFISSALSWPFISIVCWRHSFKISFITGNIE